MNPRLLPSATVARSVLRTQSDSRLTDLARAGSEPAFEAIVARYRRSLVRHCARVVGDGDAEEAVQEGLLKAHAALLAGDPVLKLAPWLHVVAHNTALSYLRARLARPQPAVSDYECCATVDTSAEHRQELGEVLDAVRSLPDRQRAAIVMRELEGRSYDEIAARLGSSHGAVRQLLHRARSSVRDRVTALLPLEPLARWALTGTCGADAAGGAGLSGVCVLGAKACAALLVPATVALVASVPASRPTTSREKAARPSAVATASYAHHTVAAATPWPTVTRVASVTDPNTTRRVPASASQYTHGFAAYPPSAAATKTTLSSRGSSTTGSSPARSESPVRGQAAGSPAPAASPDESTPSLPTSVVAVPAQRGSAGVMSAPGTGGGPSSPSSLPAPGGSQGAQHMRAAVSTPVR